jgi:hypothetical protein
MNVLNVNMPGYLMGGVVAVWYSPSTDAAEPDGKNNIELDGYIVTDPKDSHYENH